MKPDEFARLMGESPAMLGLTLEGMALSAREAEALEEALRARPDDLEIRARLIAYYVGLEFASSGGVKERAAHVRWLVEHAPGSELAGSTYARLLPDPELPVIEALWRNAVASRPADAATYFNAGRFLQPRAPEDANALLREAWRLDPSLPEPPSLDALMQALSPAEPVCPDEAPASGFLGHTEAVTAAVRSGGAPTMEADATALLEEAEQFRGDWNYGNAVHYGHTALGLAAVMRGDVKEAARQLLQAGATPGSPQLDSFGPTFALAQRLLAEGERVAVLAYFDLCARFWQLGRGRLDSWRRQLHAGETPEFGFNLNV